MESEPNKTIEEMLKASAQARRAEFGADAQMPNPMRARLHDEIARRNKEESQNVTRGFAFWFPRFAIGAVVAAVLIGGPVFMLQQKTGSHIADTMSVTNDSLKAEPTAQSADKLTAELAGKAELDEDKIAAARTKGDVAQAETQSVSASAPAAAIAAAPAPAEKNEEDLQAQTSNGLAGSAFADATKAKQNSVGLKQFAEVTISPAPVLQGGVNANANQRLSKAFVPAGALARNQNFRQQTQNVETRGARFNSQLQRAASALNNFQVEQKGTQIRIVDEDGSTYTGKIEAIAQNDSRSLSNPQAQAPATRSYAAAPRSDSQAGATEFHFNASGYNDRLGKRLVFEGNYIIPRGQENSNEPAKPAQKKDEAPARIVGTAKISGESPILVDAVAVPQ